MFTLKEVKELDECLGKRTSLAEYLRALNAIGVERYDSFISDGHSEYYGAENQKLVSSAAYESLTVADKSNREEMMRQLGLREAGKTDYTAMSHGLAASGIEKWTFNTNKMTIAYYDKQGNELLLEDIK